MKLIITEKPSVAQNISLALGINKRKDGYIENDKYIITWCVGHLVQLATPEMYNENYKTWNMDNLPIFPEEFKYNINKQTIGQFSVIQKLMTDEKISEIICATDAGREGQLIFEYVYNVAKCSKPVKRLWISSMTEEAIKDGFNDLKDNKDYFNLYQSAKSRSEADWLVGINATRLFTVKYNQKLTIGRVQTPTLAMLVKRQGEINSFTSQSFYEVEAMFDSIHAVWNNENGTRIDNIETAEKIIKKCKDKNGVITKINVSKMAIERPLLYDLTELQRDGNRKYAYTAEQTLEAAQNLYEKYKLTTYPRTDSRYLTHDMESKLIELLNKIKQGYKIAEKCVDKVLKQGTNVDKRVIDDTKVTDHHAIIVTDKIESVDLKALPEKEQNILKLIIARFIVVLDKKHEYEQTDITLKIEDEMFKAKGKKIVVNGWKDTDAVLLGVHKENQANEDEIKTEIKENQEIKLAEIKILDKKTLPPKPYNEATLLTAMESAGKQIEDENLREDMKGMGLGTPATRAGIIEKIISSGYVTREKKNLIPTNDGIELIKIVPYKLRKPDLTGEWESTLSKIADGKEQASEFIENIKKYMFEIVVEEKDKNKIDVSFTNSKSEKEVIGKCPRCSKNIYENQKSFYCEGYKDNPKCTFSIWKQNKFFEDKGKKLSKTMIKKLLSDKKIEVTGLLSKKGTKYDAIVLLDDTVEYVNFKMEFINKK